MRARVNEGVTIVVHQLILWVADEKQEKESVEKALMAEQERNSQIV